MNWVCLIGVRALFLLLCLSLEAAYPEWTLIDEKHQTPGL